MCNECHNHTELQVLLHTWEHIVLFLLDIFDIAKMGHLSLLVLIRELLSYISTALVLFPLRIEIAYANLKIGDTGISQK